MARVFHSTCLIGTAQRIVVTKMMLRNGETGVIGGLREEEDATSETKVPIFGDIPVLGRLFTHRSKSTTATNLLIFVTPTIVDFHESDTFRKELDRVRQDFAKPLHTDRRGRRRRKVTYPI